MKSFNIQFSLQIQKVHFWLNTFKKLDLFRFQEQMGRAGIYHTYNFLLQTMLDTCTVTFSRTLMCHSLS